MIFVLVTSFLFPNGLMNFSQFESKSLLIAYREGSANCNTTLKLKENHRFIETDICFGITETTGEYRVSGDTIYFENVSLVYNQKEFYQYAVIIKNDKDKGLGSLQRYRNASDMITVSLWVIKNELEK